MTAGESQSDVVMTLAKAVLLLLDLEGDRLMIERANLPDSADPSRRQSISQSQDSVDRLMGELRSFVESRPH